MVEAVCRRWIGIWPLGQGDLRGRDPAREVEEPAAVVDHLVLERTGYRPHVHRTAGVVHLDEEPDVELLAQEHAVGLRGGTAGNSWRGAHLGPVQAVLPDRFPVRPRTDMKPGLHYLLGGCFL
jgi:hypothetical protein